ncbi:hypothetical protein [Parvularcula dongshanensis]|uniref:Na+/proline symporter n=1 Tax=Parvularcula dongshanensis TaxID=1173995 RepID=A0A840I1J3_9PROT|nr:hypothetical protein [Parvularcula dongshanensis]MBB4658689.1 Na+/proline symporter [Parvularcula dongshanensis]
MADPNTTGTTTGTTTPGTAPGATPGTTTTAGTTTGTGYTADNVRVAPADNAPATRKDSAATKGLIVGILTFIGLWLLELAINSTPLPEYGRVSVADMIVYAIIGIIVGVVVKLIDKSRSTKTTKV